MRSLLDKAGRARAKVSQRLGGFRGHVDGVIGQELVGWVQPAGGNTAHPGTRLRVALFVQGARVQDMLANLHRTDLETTGIGDGRFGFAFRLSEDLMRLLAANGGVAEVRVLQGATQNAFLGRCRVVDDTGATGAAAGRHSALERRLFSGLELLSNRLARPEDHPLPPAPAPLPPRKAALFSTANLPDTLPGRPVPADLPVPVCAYMDYVRYRSQVDDRFAMRTEEDAAHFAKFYISSYSTMRGTLRAPLSADLIAWANDPLRIPGQSRHLSRAAWAFLMEVPPILHSMDFSNHDWYIWAVYWWCVNQTQSMGVEDCLVPDFMAEALRAVPERWQDHSFAPSEYMLRMHSEIPELTPLPLDSAAGRRDLASALMVMALTRPDTLRYIPQAILEALLEPGAEARAPTYRRLFRGEAADSRALARFCARLGHEMPGLNRDAYARALRASSFDLESMRFLTTTTEGHRAGFAQLPPITGETVDVQVIGPFRKASGLGQATRLSGEILRRAARGPLPGLTVNTVDFGLDNPAYEGFNAEAEVSDYKPARVNLIHLNAESFPLAAAYLPDVFTGSYTIGYFYWELDGPAAPHHLALELLDEVWVSSDYGVEIYQPYTDKPVTNVGMSYETVPEIDRAEARALLQDKTPVKDGDFVFLMIFDSFSFAQRKNPLGVLEAFEAAFPKGRDKHVRLVIKTQNRDRVVHPEQFQIWDRIDAALARDPRISVLNETLPYREVLQLKKGSDAYVSLHRSEGWGFGMVEAMNLGVPVLATGYSGNMEFCNPEVCWLVDYRLVEVAPRDYIFVRAGQHWAEPDTDHAARQMQAMRSDPEECARKAAAARAHVQAAFSEEAIARRYAARVREILDDMQTGAGDAGPRAGRTDERTRA